MLGRDRMSTRALWLALTMLPAACIFRVEGEKGVSGTGGNDAPDLAMVAVVDAAVPATDFAPSMVPMDATLPPPPDLAPSCFGPGVIYCDDFEDPHLRGWLVGQKSGTVSIDQQHVYHGQYALHAHQDQVVDGASAFLLRGIAYPSPDIYVRVFLYAAAAPSTAAALRVQQSKGQQQSVDLQVSPTNFLVRDSKTGIAEPSTVSIFAGRWLCLEWQLHVAGDGYVVITRDRTDKWTSTVGDITVEPDFDWLVVGLQNNASSTANDLWFDALVVSSAPIGCDAH
jgi:hypothetical protein